MSTAKRVEAARFGPPTLPTGGALPNLDPVTKELDHNPVAAAARGRCPRCASGRLFEGFLTPARECEACGLDFRFIDSGDGPAVFVILVVGFLTVGLALYAEVAFDMPLWLHFVLWPVLAVALSLPLLRLLKGALIGQQFARSAAEGRVAMHGEARRPPPRPSAPDAPAPDTPTPDAPSADAPAPDAPSVDVSAADAPRRRDPHRAKGPAGDEPDPVA